MEDVVITHLHYDHVGNFDLFPRARFHLQDREMAYATGRYMAVEHFSHAYEPDEVIAMVRNVYAGRVEFHDGDAQIGPRLSVHHIGGHTACVQAGHDPLVMQRYQASEDALQGIAVRLDAEPAATDQVEST